jgi:hypothetical protein
MNSWIVLLFSKKFEQGLFCSFSNVQDIVASAAASFPELAIFMAYEMPYVRVRLHLRWWPENRTATSALLPMQHVPFCELKWQSVRSTNKPTVLDAMKLLL